ncbi:GTP-binding protein [Lachnospira multipara]|uniref:GTP-binding protein n=1 Tax=Lachnospira multipara TaxID=28051 RepID=UPI0004218DC6|nr:GTP-binding protein [Lachnospira multipara]
MIKVDLITGFLGSGKTTFIKQYVNYLISKGENIGIIENDYGAVNVDMLLLEDAIGDDADLEMVAGGCDYDCHRRRFKTKLIALGMLGYDRVLIEPSGIYDVDEFFDVLNEDPLNRLYEIGNVITVIDSKLENELSNESNYLLCSQVSRSGKILLSHSDLASTQDIENTKAHLKAALLQFKGNRELVDSDFIEANLNELDSSVLEGLTNCGYNNFDHEKLRIDDNNSYNSVYLLNHGLSIDSIKKLIDELYRDEKCGKVFRVKGFAKGDQPESENLGSQAESDSTNETTTSSSWYQINATVDNTEIKQINVGQDVLIIIGESLDEKYINEMIENYR